MKQVSITGYETIQEYQKLFNISFTCSISTWVYKVINALRLEGNSEVELVFDNEEVIPKTYRINPWCWAILILKDKVDFPNIRVFKRLGKVVVSASETLIKKKSFKPDLVARLQKSNRVVFALEEIPYAYKKQPYYLVSILREQFPSLAITLQEKQYIYTHNEKI